VGAGDDMFMAISPNTLLKNHGFIDEQVIRTRNFSDGCSGDGEYNLKLIKIVTKLEL